MQRVFISYFCLCVSIQFCCNFFERSVFVDSAIVSKPKINNTASNEKSVEVDAVHLPTINSGENDGINNRSTGLGKANHTKLLPKGITTAFEIVTLKWHHVELPYTIAAWLLFASVAKILFHVHKKFGEAIPDSALLIFVGLVLGFALHTMNVSTSLYTLKSTTFFLYLLPPIIFDAGYFMPNRQLFDNLDSVLLFAIVGTIWNTIAIGFTLLLLGQVHMFSVPFSAFEILLFASLISAVDPVAVIAVFEEIHVNEFLFINVFGEALFNDGVSVVLYQMFLKFTLIGEQNLRAFDYAAGVASFFVISLGGIFIGLVFAVVVSLATRFCSRVKIIAPVFIFTVPYLAYLTAEMFGLSAILAIVACGIMMKQYVKENMTHDASSSVKYFVKMLAQCTETVIFMFLGLSTVSSKHQIDIPFVSVTLFLCLFYRTIGVIVQCAVLNRFRSKKFSLTDQFVLAYGGLRGAIAFGLVVSLPSAIKAKQTFVTTCIAVILFTVFLQGITIRPLLYWLKVEKHKDTKDMLIEKIYNRYFDYTMAGIEDIIGQRGKNTIRENFDRFNAKILKPLLIRHVTRKTFPKFDASHIIRAYRKITLQEALKLALAGSEFKTTVDVTEVDYSITNQMSVKSAYEERETSRVAEKITRSYSDRFNVERVKPEIRSPRTVRFDVDQENIEMLYQMFSTLLDRKINELKATETPEMTGRKPSDIKSDYLKEMKSLTSSATASSSVANSEIGEDQGDNTSFGIPAHLKRQAFSLDQSDSEEANSQRPRFPRRVSEQGALNRLNVPRNGTASTNKNKIRKLSRVNEI